MNGRRERTMVNWMPGRMFVSAAVAAACAMSASAQCPSQWLPLAAGMPNPNGEVDALVVSGTDLMVAGSFTVAGPPLPQPTNRIAKWNGSSWSLVGAGFNETVLALAVYHGQIIATGLFTGTGAPFPPQAFSYIARYDQGTGTWSPLGAGLDAPAVALAVYNDDLIVGGVFTQAGGEPNLAIAKWHDDGPGTAGTWSGFGNGLGGTTGAGVYALAVYNGEVVAGGEFETAGGQAANRIARSDGGVWLTLSGPAAGNAGIGVDSSVQSLTVFEGDLVAGGVFTAAGGAAASHVARWNLPAGWRALGGGFNNSVTALGMYGPHLYAGGQFTMANTPQSAANRVARWTGAAWAALGGAVPGGGVSGTPYALTPYRGDLFVGGAFTSTDGQGIARLVRWSAPGLACRADFDCNHLVEPGDVSLFVNVWFASLTQGTLAGDFDGNGLVEPADVSLFVQVWFGAVAGGC